MQATGAPSLAPTATLAEEGDYVGLPTDEASWNFSTFTMDEYNTVLEKIRNGEIKVDNNSDDATKPTTSSNITVDYQV